MMPALMVFVLQVCDNFNVFLLHLQHINSRLKDCLSITAAFQTLYFPLKTQMLVQGFLFYMRCYEEDGNLQLQTIETWVSKNRC